MQRRAVARVSSSKLTFKQRPSTYRISSAPTSRGHCRKCRKRILKGDPRIEICAFIRPGRSTVLLRCAQCIDTTFAHAVLKVYTCAERVPADASLDASKVARIRHTITETATTAKEKEVQ